MNPIRCGPGWKGRVPRVLRPRRSQTFHSGLLCRCGGQNLRGVPCRGTHDAISRFAETLGAEDHVCLEATFHTWAIWAILSGHAGKVVVANPMQVKAIAHARIKTDKVDAHILAQLLRANFNPEVSMPE